MTPNAPTTAKLGPPSFGLKIVSSAAGITKGSMQSNR